MSKAQYYCANSVDGYIAEADDTIEWLLKYEGRLGGTRSSQLGCLRALPMARPKVEMLSCCDT
ncbi:MAG: hypothetical protein H0U16_11485 [Actinobacteria bacterium]|nr:hypothetical protein [Actinomycetota bacterium]